MIFRKISLHATVLPEDILELSTEKRVESIPCLLDALQEMNDEAFSHHVSKSRNEFAEWILESYGDEKLAKKVQKTRKRRKLIKMLQKALKREKNSSLKKVKENQARKILLPQTKKMILEELKKLDDHLHPRPHHG